MSGFRSDPIGIPFEPEAETPPGPIYLSGSSLHKCHGAVSAPPRAKPTWHPSPIIELRLEGHAIAIAIATAAAAATA